MKLLRKCCQHFNISNVAVKGKLTRLKFSLTTYQGIFFMKLSVLKNKYPNSRRIGKENIFL